MNRVKYWALRVYVWCCRIPQRRGYGIHSPYAFHLVTKVCYDRTAYLAYRYLLPHRREGTNERRLDHLCYRLAKHFQPHTLLNLSGDTCTLRYFKAACRHPLQIFTIGSQENVVIAALSRPIEMVYVRHITEAAPIFPEILSHCSPDAVFILQDIHSSDAAYTLWQRIIALPRVRVSFDLYWVGIVCLEERLNKQDYVINF